jgi:predicted site-specific integrase-resolvase
MMTKKEVATQLYVTVETVRDWIAAGKLPVNSQGLIDPQDVDQLDLSYFEDSPDWIPMKAAAKYLGVSRATIFNYTCANKLTRATLRGRTFISLASIKDLLATRSQEVQTRIDNLHFMEA